jgi:hypothetical protein
MSDSELSASEERQKYIKLSVKGVEQYRNLQYASIKKFLFWVFVGSAGGLVLSKGVDLIPVKQTSQFKMKRVKNWTFFASFAILSYHGYKLARRDFRKGRRDMLKDKENILEEPI